MESPVILQKISKQYPTPLEVAVRYYSVLSVLFDFKLTTREIQLLAFTATRGSISTGGAKEQFISLFGTSKATIGNMVHKLSVKGFLVKENGRIKVHPELSTKFNSTLVLNLIINSDDSKRPETVSQ